MFRHSCVVVPKTTTGTLLSENTALVASALARFHAHINLHRFGRAATLREVQKILPIRSAADFRAITKPQDMVFFMDVRTNYSTHSQ